MHNLNRRQALLLLTTLGGWSVLAPARAAPGAGLPPLLSRFEEGIDLQAAARLGRDYLELRPDEASLERLLDNISVNTGSVDPAAVLAGRIRQDFADGNVIELRDWQVSVTEARIYAILTLL